MDGNLVHDPSAKTIKTYYAGTSVLDFVAEARFVNPYSTNEGAWDYGFIFRRSAPGTFDIVTVGSNLQWRHYIRRADKSDELKTSGGLGLVKFDKSPLGSNLLKLIVVRNEGWFFLNGKYAGILTFDTLAESGDAAVATGYFAGNEVEGATTKFEDFSVQPVEQVYGPARGDLVGVEGFFAVHASGLAVQDVVVEASFVNPPPGPEESWSYGILIRGQGANTFDAVFVRSNRKWYHYTRSGSVESSQELGSGFAGINIEPHGTNRILLIASDSEGWLFVNGSYVSTLNLGLYDVQGDVLVFSGYFKDDETPGTVFKFREFSVWSLEQ